MVCVSDTNSKIFITSGSSDACNPWADSAQDPIFDSLSISPSRLYPATTKQLGICEDLFGGGNGEFGVLHMNTIDSLTQKLPPEQPQKYKIRRTSGFLISREILLQTWDGTVVCRACVGTRFGIRTRVSFLCQEKFMGTLTSNFIGSKYRFEGGNEQILPLLTIDFENRITSNQDNLGPCRRFAATIFPKTSEFVPSLNLQHKQAGSTATCESFDIFSDSILTSLRLSTLEPTKGPNGYCLDFESAFRVTPSVHNFILTSALGDKVLSLCKIDKNEFELFLVGGFICPLHAFVIATASLDTKLCTQ